MLRTSLIIALAALAGCTSDVGDSGGDAGPEPDASGDLDLSRASWTVSPVDDAEGTVSFDPDVVITAAGEPVYGWIDLVAGVGSYQVFSAAGDDLAIEPRGELLTGGTLSWVSMTTVADRLHLVIAGASAGNTDDVRYARRDGDTWSALTDVTTPGDPDDLAKSLPTPVDVNGRVFVVFQAKDPAAGGNGIYAVQFADAANPGAIEPLLDRAEYSCTGLHAVGDGEGTIYVAANCSDMGGPRQLMVGNDRTGEFVFQSADLGGSTNPHNFELAVDSQGHVHLVWAATVDCGGASCTDVLYSRDLGPPISVTNEPQEGGDRPRLAVDDSGRVIVVYHREKTDDADLLWTYRETNGFVRSQQVLPTEPGIKHWRDGGLAIDPTTGRVRTVFLRTDPQAMPENADIMAALLH